VDALLLFEVIVIIFTGFYGPSKTVFGSTREIGVFEMSEKGLLDVPNPRGISG